ncbi:hypothetical protein RB195_014643 [Necator americanus]|uniref:Uncharacterized protein n=1 Tax=Necator americanus TaxID=51031 RepID=A0ABR1E3R1_NECAM
MASPESRRKTAAVDHQILFDSVENGGVFDSVGASRLELVFEVGVSFCKAGKPALDSPDGILLLMSRATAVAPMPPRHS